MRPALFLATILVAFAVPVSAAPASYVYAAGTATELGGGVCDEAPFVAGVHRGGVCWVEVDGPVRVSVRDDVRGLVPFAYMMVGPGGETGHCSDGSLPAGEATLDPGACLWLHVFAPAGSASGTITVIH